MTWDPTACRLELTEWSQGFAEGVVLRRGDTMLVDRLATGPHDARVTVREVGGGVTVSTSAGVGVLRFHEFEVRIRPKLAGSNLRLVEMFEFATRLDALERHPAVRNLATGNEGLLDLIGLLLVEETEQILAGGLLADYVVREEDLPTIRGRLLADRQWLERFGQVDRLVCRYDEHEHDIIENRLLGLALAACSRRLTDPTVKRRARQLQGILEDVCDPLAIDPSPPRDEINYHRLNAHYRDAHELAWLIIDGLGTDDVLRSGATSSFAFVINMNDLFERFVEQLLRTLTNNTAYGVEAQRRDRSIIRDAETGKPRRTIVPDLLVTLRGAPAARVALDAKYKRYDDREVDMGDLYQTFLYAFAYASEESVQLPAAALLYPSSRRSVPPSGFRVDSFERVPRAEITVLGVHIPTVLDELNSERLGGPETDALFEAVADLVDPGLTAAA